jgi:hypothetical protein
MLLLTAGCAGGERAPEEHEPRDSEPVVAAPAPPPPPASMSAADSAAALARIAAERDSLLATFDSVLVLRAREVAELRQDRNAEQIAVARRLGLQPTSGAAEVERLRAQGRLVPLGDSTPYWVLRDMEHSSPYVTPDTRAMLEDLGRRFHARLDALGLPRYRMKVTSALRTDESQAELRRINANASRIVSAHEFATTVDVSHERFAVPAEPQTPTPAWEMEAEMLEEVGKDHSRALQAELGRAIQELRQEGGLMVMMEDAQPVYHMTVARAYGR